MGRGVTIAMHADRFWRKVNKTETCWLWAASINSRGYGQFKMDGRSWQAHRIAYELQVGPIPDGLQIDHLCRVRACVNPDHLEAVSQEENIRRGEGVAVANAIKTHCPQGHPYDEANTYIYHGARQCRACSAARDRRRTQRRWCGQ